MALTADAATSSKSTDNPVVPCRQFAYLAELNPADNSKFIQIKVYRKWTSVKMPGFTPTAFSCMLLDKKGSAIQANADLKEKERFDHDLQMNCVYKIQGFGFEKADPWGKTLDNDITLCFGKYTQTDLLQDKDFPSHYFNFAAFNELNARLEKKNPILTDYIGYVHNVEKVKEYGGVTTSRVKVRNIGIRNLKYNQANMIVPQLDVQTERLTNWKEERNRNRVPLATLLQIDPKTQQRVLFTQDAMILQIDTGHDWYYQKCDECGGKLRYGYLHGQCHQYGTKPNPENSYCFRIVITDGTGNATMSCFTPQTDGLIKDINTLLEEVENKDPSTIPAAILALQNTRHVFQFQFATPTLKGPPTFVLKKIMDKPAATLRESSAGPSSPPADLPESLTNEESTPPPATPTVTQDTPIHTSTETHQPVHSAARKELFVPTTEEEDDPALKKQKKD
ncbi:nucleic acid-binding, OB-fold protein [Artemisia annua]|uniref:Nucleic acid-binding, OB-fold protein n=1 Tax=Artemisia annua TaxID=35608 RepID=A0A2U1KDY1_ARTAN|nr:nucleic acid-binding, OB-fold protein [Artemisia annua]